MKISKSSIGIIKCVGIILAVLLTAAIRLFLTLSRIIVGMAHKIR